MKTLRLLRNIAAVFMFGTALLLSRPNAARASQQQACSSTSQAYNCTYDSNGNCRDSACLPGGPCSYQQCGGICKHCKF